MLVIAAEPLRGALVELARSKHLDVHACTTPLDACQALERVGARTAYAIISSDPPWGLELRRLLDDEYRTRWLAYHREPSGELGQGSKFWLDLPVHRRVTAEQGPAVTEARASPP